MKIGVFDSGLGGLTVVTSILQTLPDATIVYIADTAYAPYGEKSFDAICERSLLITRTLIDRFGVDAVVVACNTATAAAIHTLRETYPNIPIVGTEPGIKPAGLQSAKGKVGVLATPATLRSEKYRSLASQVTQTYGVTIIEQACPGLADRIEAGHIDDTQTVAMLQRWLAPMQKEGVDTIVLGCTHYPLVSHLIDDIMPSGVTLIDTGEAIARRLSSLITPTHQTDPTSMVLYATGEIDTDAVTRILAFRPIIRPLDPHAQTNIVKK